MYGAIAGEAYFRGVAGERFCVRNSGASAVVEGTGDHGCEYMTGGTVVVLGRTGRNFAAGMSGGIAYVYDEDGTFAQRCNTSMVALEPVLTEAEQAKAEKELAAAGKGRLRHAGRADEALLRELIERHLRFTGSTLALAILDDWDAARRKFVKVFPHEYQRALTEMHAKQAAAKPAAQAPTASSCRRDARTTRARRDDMGKITGFMELAAHPGSGAAAAGARAATTASSCSRSTDDAASKQGARCMDCGIPFCQTGCPVNNIIPDWNDLVYRQQWRAALDVLHSTNNFPGVHRPRLPGALRGGVHAQHQRRSGRHQVDRALHHRQGLGRGLGRAAAAARRRPASASRSSAPGRRGSRARSSSRAPATTSCCSRRPTASAACCATAFPTSRWRST